MYSRPSDITIEHVEHVHIVKSMPVKRGSLIYKVCTLNFVLFGVILYYLRLLESDFVVGIETNIYLLWSKYKARMIRNHSINVLNRPLEESFVLSLSLPSSVWVQIQWR